MNFCLITSKLKKSKILRSSGRCSCSGGYTVFGATDDYINFSPNPTTGFATVPIGFDNGTISFTPENTENFTISLYNGPNTTTNIDIGSVNPQIFTIYDNDNTPQIGVAVVNASSSENSGAVTIIVVRSCNIVPPVSVEYQLKTPGGTATTGTKTCNTKINLTHIKNKLM